MPNHALHFETNPVVQALLDFIRHEAEFYGSSVARNPGPRIPFSWPPHPVSFDYHVHATDWDGSADFHAYGEQFKVKVAKTAFGVFGRCEEIWHEDRGDTLVEMLANLKSSSEPLFRQQLLISRTIGKPGRFYGPISQLENLDLLKLLFCPDRDIAHQAKQQLDALPDHGSILAPLVAIILDNSHPYRRSAQWSVLDLFEDLPVYLNAPGDEWAVLEAMKRLIWEGQDDYARVVFKAGVVLGGHIPHRRGGPILIECLNAPSKIGRRSAIHGLYHVVEWMPEMEPIVLESLERVAKEDSEPSLRAYASEIHRDIVENEVDHAVEPIFSDEI